VTKYRKRKRVSFAGEQKRGKIKGKYQQTWGQKRCQGKIIFWWGQNNERVDDTGLTREGKKRADTLGAKRRRRGQGRGRGRNLKWALPSKQKRGKGEPGGSFQD